MRLLKHPKQLIRSSFYDQYGFSPIFLLLILIVGLVTAVILVKEGSNIFSKAFNPSQAAPSYQPERPIYGRILVSGFSLLRQGSDPLKAAMFKGEPATSPSQTIIAPIFYVNYYGYNSIAYVSNTSSEAARVRLSFYSVNPSDVNSSQATYSTTVNIPPHGTQAISLEYPYNPARSFADQVFTQTGQRFAVATLVAQVESTRPSPTPNPTSSPDSTLSPSQSNAFVGIIGMTVTFNKKDDRSALDDLLRIGDVSNSKISNAFRDTLSESEDYFVDTMQAQEDSGYKLVYQQVIGKVSHGGADYLGGLLVTNNTPDPQDFLLKLYPTNVKGQVFQATNPKLFQGKLVQGGVKLAPFETRQIFVSDLLNSLGAPLTFNGAATVEGVVQSGQVDKDSRLSGSYYFSRDNEAYGRGTSSFPAMVENSVWVGNDISSIARCSYNFPLLNRTDYDVMKNMESGVAAVYDSEKYSNDYIRLVFYPQNQPGSLSRNLSTVDMKVERNFPNLFYLPDTKYVNQGQQYALKACAFNSDGGVTSVTNSLRRDLDKSFLNFGAPSYSERELSNKWYVSYFARRFNDRRIIDSWVVPFNPSETEGLDYSTIKRSYSNPIGIVLPRGGLDPGQYTNRIIGIDGYSTDDYGYFEIETPVSKLPF